MAVVTVESAEAWLGIFLASVQRSDSDVMGWSTDAGNDAIILMWRDGVQLPRFPVIS